MRSIRFTKFSRVSSFSWACASWAWAALACAGFVASGCKRPPSEPEKSEGPLVLASRGSEGDSPVFTLASATQGVEGSGPLTATIETTKGTLTCTLFEDKAPVTVANFVGLARGTRKWKQGRGGPWVTRPFYDGLKFHRVIPGFVIQGGDQNGDGSGDAGYEFIDEVWPGAKHDRAGLMCMANHGPNTNSSQFFITDGVTPHLDGGYSIFGECKQIDIVHAIATVPSQRERPTDHVTMTKVTIARASR